MSNLLKTHRVLKKDNKTLVHINIPEDCVYDISYIIVQLESEKEPKILSEDIPEFIKENMLKFFRNSLEEFVEFIETNLEIFLSGKIPEDPKKNLQKALEKDSKKNLLNVLEKDEIIRLPDSYHFPINKLSFNNLNIDVSKRNIHFLTCKSPNFEVQCKRCKKNKNVSETGHCVCGIDLKINYVPVLDSEYLGSIFPDNCSFLCLNPSRFQFNCDKCGTNFESNKVGPNSKFLMNCWECGTQISFLIKKLIFIEKKTQVFKKGEELPNRGACKHYKKSYRWFRFPCCGSVYPCDICHDAETNHEHKLANKMVCGLCSKEQSVKKDCDCGMNLKKSTNCWEGGKGNRNKLSMNKKDKKKYTK
ncbi:hypothetical protein NGRA_0159 [Nosema granulosis]|uniref:CHY-type domain-containing protein n=1 Tax=Nosema granulosis TaxID=83296 RepID=A0A9P6L0T1_9MICR|nr:hypothetical protein NGRA_0159 [Nosema granulosis]